MTPEPRITLPRCSFKPRSVAYALKMALATLLVWPALAAVGIPHPTWAIVTIAAVSDPDLSAAQQLVKTRVTNTLAGCVIAILCVVLFGATLASMIGALMLSVLLVTSIEHYPSNWRLAPITVAILMGAAVGDNSQKEALLLAWLRTSEIISGSLAALFMAWIFSSIMSWLSKNHQNHDSAPSDE